MNISRMLPALFAGLILTACGSNSDLPDGSEFLPETAAVVSGTLTVLDTSGPEAPDGYGENDRVPFRNGNGRLVEEPEIRFLGGPKFAPGTV